MTENKRFYYYGDGEDINSGVIDGDTELTLEETIGIMNELHEDNEQLKKDVEFWKQVASQYSNELNVFKHCEEHKTKCNKNIYWRSDVE